MVSKVFPGHSFYHACRYVVNKQGAQVLAYEGVRGHDFKVMSDDFIMQQQMRTEKEKACFHCALSFYPGEKVSDEQMVRIAKEYLAKMKIINTQFAVTKHTDRKHIHLHLVANMVDNNGKAISDSFLGLRGKKIAQQLTAEYNLISATSKNLKLINQEALHKSEGNKYKVYQAIMEALSKCKTMEELEKKLQVQGIKMQYKYKGQTTEKQGVSFKLGEDTFKGSKVDRQFSLGNLEKTFASQQKTLGAEPNIMGSSTTQSANEGKENKARSENFLQDLSTTKLTGSLENTLEILLKPEEDYGQTPHELLKENKRKRKKQSRNHRGGLHH